MSKLTPMILALLMLASTSLVALDWAELEKEQQMEKHLKVKEEERLLLV